MLFYCSGKISFDCVCEVVWFPIFFISRLIVLHACWGKFSASNSVALFKSSRKHEKCKNIFFSHFPLKIISFSVVLEQWPFNYVAYLKQNHIFKAREGKYQTRINALETLAVGTTTENEVFLYFYVLSLLMDLGQCLAILYYY